LGFSNHRIVDAHAHLCDPVFDTDRPAVIKRARTLGVGAIIAVSENLSDAKRNIELAVNHPELKPAAGLYPTDLDLNKAQAMVSFFPAMDNRP
jgi:TatD DNase family protein